MITALALAVTLVATTFVVHYKALRISSGLLPQVPVNLQARVLIVISLAFLAHMIEIVLYAVAYAVSVEWLGLGGFGGMPVESALDYLYFSIVTYTSLGLGDVFPQGHLRFLTGVEALNGLLLIAWSGSFTYLAMGRLWPWAPCDDPASLAQPQNTQDRAATS